MAYGQMDPEGSWPTGGDRTYSNYITNEEIDRAERELEEHNRRYRERYAQDIAERRATRAWVR